MISDSQVFWRGILQVGILDNVMQDIVSAVQKLKLELVMSSVGKEGKTLYGFLDFVCVLTCLSIGDI